MYIAYIHPHNICNTYIYVAEAPTTITITQFERTIFVVVRYSTIDYFYVVAKSFSEKPPATQTACTKPYVRYWYNTSAPMPLNQKQREIKKERL